MARRERDGGYTGDQILVNSAMCAACGDVLISEHDYDMRFCSCGEIFIDGGTEYPRRGARDFQNVIELTCYEGA